MIFAYVGPEVTLPLATALAGVIGSLLVVGRAPFRLAARVLRVVMRGASSSGKEADPRADRPPEAR